VRARLLRPLVEPVIGIGGGQEDREATVFVQTPKALHDKLPEKMKSAVKSAKSQKKRTKMLQLPNKNGQRHHLTSTVTTV
jgi:hypothetical protein